MVKNPPAMQETLVWSLGQEDALEKEMAMHSSILVWRISWIEEAGGLQSMGFRKVGHDWVTNHTHTLVYNAALPHLKLGNVVCWIFHVWNIVYNNHFMFYILYSCIHSNCSSQIPMNCAEQGNAFFFFFNNKKIKLQWRWFSQGLTANQFGSRLQYLRHMGSVVAVLGL